MSPAYPNSEPSSDSLNTYSNVVLDGPADTAALMVQQQQQQQQQQQLSASLEGNYECPSVIFTLLICATILLIFPLTVCRL